MLLVNPLPQLKVYCTILTEEILRALTDEKGKVRKQIIHIQSFQYYPSQITNWAGFLNCIYNGGIEESLRPKVTFMPTNVVRQVLVFLDLADIARSAPIQFQP